MKEAKKIPEKMPHTFRAWVPYIWFVNITIECVGVTVEAQAQKSLSVSGNNYVKVLEKRPHPQSVERVWRWTPKFNNFYNVFKNNAFTAHFGLRFLLKIMFLNYCYIIVLVCPSLIPSSYATGPRPVCHLVICFKRKT